MKNGVLKKWLAALLAALAGVIALVLAYLLAAWLCGQIPRNRDFHPVLGGIPVYLVSNGVHVDMVMPVTGPCPCDRSHAPTLAMLAQPFDTGVPRRQWHWLAVGWGDAAFMLTVPTWQQLTPGIAIRAMTGLDSSVVRISSYTEPSPGPAVQVIWLSPAQYRQLLVYVQRSIVQPLQEKIPTMAGPEDRFYLSNHRYSVFNSCNEWVSKGLDEAGVRTPLWTPFPGPLLQQAGATR